MFLDANDAVGISSRNLIRVVNPAMVRMFGYADASELVGRTFLELLAPESHGMILEMVQLRARGEEVPGLYAAYALRRDGARFQVEIRTTTFVHDGEAYALALLRDLGEDTRSATELYRAIFAKNSAIKLLIDPVDGQIVDANEAAVAFYGWSVEQLRQMRISEINTLTAEEVVRELERARTGDRAYFRFRHRVASGAIRHVDVHSGPVEVAGRPLLLSIVQDTTERDAFEDQLRQNQKLEAIGRLAGGIAHDFNNLLTIILGCGTSLREQLDPEGPGPDQLRDLVQATERASELTRRLLAVGQRQHLEPRPVDVAGVVRGTASLLSRAVGPGIDLAFALSDGLTADVDPVQLEQVVTNLVLNAAEASGGQGRVDVVVERRGSDVEIRVVDRGRGMDEATRARVFDPFFSVRPDGSGTGLGLASVRGIVIQSGGTVSVDSELGAGATFRVRLPVVPAAHVLVIDDEPALRELLAECLVSAGYRVTSLPSGVEALALGAAELDDVDIVVTDQIMPGPSGIEVATELKRRRPVLRVLLVSGNLTGQERARLPAWMGYLPKPFSRSKLLERLTALPASAWDAG